MADYTIRSEAPGIKDAALETLLGECLGSGWTRRVYALNFIPDRVMKIEHSVEHSPIWMSNAMEWRIWQTVKDTEHAKWFAPCYNISFTGQCLIQARTTPVSYEDFSTIAELPDYLSDCWEGNFGWWEGRIVCHDYGRTNFLKIGMLASQMVPRETYHYRNGG